MPDDTITVRIVGEERGVNTVLDQSRARVEALADALKHVDPAADGARDSALGLAKAWRQAKAESSLLEKALGEAADGTGNLRQEIRHTIALFDEFNRGARGQMIASLSAMLRDSGNLGKVIGALKGPFGVALAGAVGLAGALYEVAKASMEAESALRGVYNTALVQGRNAPLAEANTRALAQIISARGTVTPGGALPMAAMLESIPELSEKARRALARVAEAWIQTQFGGNMKEAGKKIPAMFGSIGTMQKLVDQNRLLTGSAYQAFSTAAGEKDIRAAADLFAQGIAARFAPAAAAIKGLAPSGKELISEATHGVGTQFGIVGTGPTALIPPSRLPGPLRLPSYGEMEANRFIAEGNKLENQKLGILREIKVIEDQIKAGHVADNAAARTAIARLQTKAALIDREIGLQTSRAAGLSTGAGVRNAMPGNAKPIAAALMAAHLGLSNADIGIILGGLYGEGTQHGVGFNPLALNRTSGAFGIAQWLGPRKSALIASGGANTLQGQIAFLISELRGSHASALAGIKGAGSPEAKMSAFVRLFEGITPQNVAAATGGKLTGQAGFEQLIAQRLGYAGRFGGTAGEVSSAAEKSTLKGAGEMIAQLAKEDEAAAKDAAAAEKQRAQAMKQALAPVEAIIKKWPEVFKEGLAATERANAKAIAAMDRAWDRFASPIEHKISDALTDAVLGIRQRGGMREVMLGIEKSVVGGMMNNVVKGIGNSLVKPLFTSMLGSGGLGGGIANLLFNSGNETAKLSLLSIIAANTGATAAAAGVSAASTSTSAIGTGFSAIGAFSGIKSALGWIGGLFGFAHGGIVPSAAGGWSLPSFAGAQPALLHSREMVLPADISEGMQGLIRGGGAAGDVHVHNHFHGPADGASVGRWFGRNKGALTETIRDAWNSGALAFP